MCLRADALTLFDARLSAYERVELTSYPQIWYVGLDAPKVGGVAGQPHNDGFDDQHGSYIRVGSYMLASEELTLRMK